VPVIERAAQQLGPVALAGLATLFIAIALYSLRVRLLPQPARTAAWHSTIEAAIVAWLGVIGMFTLEAVADGGRGPINLVPFHSLLETLPLGDYWVQLAVTDIAVNILLFVPLGLGVGLRWPRVRAATWVVGAIALSLTIELAQALVLNRSGDITDVIANTMGALAGVGLARAIDRVGSAYGAARNRASVQAAD
jgi:VanZ like family